MLIKSSLNYFLSKVISGLIALLSIFIFTRLLNPQEYGIYAITISMMNVAYAIFFLWISLSLARFYVVQDKRPIEILHSTASISFIFVVCLFAISQSIFFGVAKPSLEPYSRIILFLLVVSYAWYELNLRVLNAEFNVSDYSKLIISRTLSALILGLVLFHWMGLEGIFYALILSSLFLPMLIARKSHLCVSLGAANKILFKEFIVYGLPLAVTSGLTLVIDFSDRFLISQLMGKEYSGLYSASYDFVLQTLGFIFGIFYLSFFPILNKHYENGQSELFQKNYLIYLNVVCAVVIPVLLIYWCFAESIANLFFGKAYQSAASLLIPLTAVAIFLGTFKAYVMDLVFFLRKRTLLQIPQTLVVAIVNVLLNLLWIPKFGLMGAVYATLASFILGTIFSLITCIKLKLLPSVNKDTCKILLSAGLMCLYILSFSWIQSEYHILLVALSSLVIYGLSLLTLNVLSVRDYIFPTGRR